MGSKAATVDAYLAELPDDRKAAINTVREVFRRNMDPAYAEVMSYGMIGYVVPHSVFPDGYHCDPRQPLPFAGLASQKGHMSLYLMGLYTGGQSGPGADLLAWFEKAWAATGKKLDMGKACVRFKKVDDLALDVLAEALRRLPCDKYVAAYEAMRPAKASKGKGKPADAAQPAKAAKPSKVAKPVKAAKPVRAAKPAKSGERGAQAP